MSHDNEMQAIRDQIRQIARVCSSLLNLSKEMILYMREIRAERNEPDWGLNERLAQAEDDFLKAMENAEPPPIPKEDRFKGHLDE